MRALLSRVRSITARALSRQSNCAPAKPRRGQKLALEELTDRVTPANIFWANQFTGDNFNAVYGANATAARAIVNRAIDDWESAIQSFNYSNPGLGDTYTVNITAEGQNPGIFGVTRDVFWEAATGKPFSASIFLDDDAAGLGWYFDPNPGDDSEFNDTQNRYMAHNNLPGHDLYQVVAHELGHALGLIINIGLAIDDFLVDVPNRNQSPYDPSAFLYNILTPGPTVGIVATITGTSHIYGGEGTGNYDQFPNTRVLRDLMNPGDVFPFGQRTRQLISHDDLSVFHWVYGYTLNFNSLRQFTPVTHEVGTFRPPAAGQVGQFHLRLTDTDFALFNYLTVDHRAIAGDWDGDRDEEVGSYYAPQGVFHLRRDDGSTDTIFFGGPNSYPVAGDWNGDGRDDIGVYYPSLARFDLLVLSTGAIIQISSFGGSTFIPVAGDWDGDGVDDLGLYDPNQALFRIRNRDGTKFSITMGGVGSLPLAGDWDGDGDDEVGTYARSLGRFVLRSNNTPADNTKTIINFGGANSTKLPLAGNWFY